MKKFLLTLLAIGLMTIPAYLIAQLYYYNTYAAILEIGSAIKGDEFIKIPFDEIKDFFIRIWIILSTIITCISIITIKPNQQTNQENNTQDTTPQPEKIKSYKIQIVISVVSILSIVCLFLVLFLV